MKTEIEKVLNFEIKGYSFKIERNKRKDVFLGIITNNNNTSFIERIQPIRVVFLSIKGAKNHAIDMINIETKN
jgi:hypothetical protein